MRCTGNSLQDLSHVPGLKHCRSYTWKLWLGSSVFLAFSQLVLEEFANQMKNIQASTTCSLLCSPNFVHTCQIALLAKFSLPCEETFHSL